MQSRSTEGLKVRMTTHKHERRLFNALVASSGERLEQDEALGRAYGVHVTRRNRLVHFGYEPSEEETRHSLTVALKLVKRFFSLYSVARR